MKKIYIVDDEQRIRELIQMYLKKEGYDTMIFSNAKDALEEFKNQEPDLMILDIMMREMDGLELCREVRKTSDVPIIFVSARSEELDRILGLELGADDYITKPFSVREVVARVKANVRRVEMIENSAVASQLLKFKDIEIDVSKYIVKVRGVEIKITFREFELLKFLAQHRDQVYSREQLLTIVWEYEYIGVDSERTVDVTVRRLREKIETDPSNPEFVITKRGR